MDNSVQTQYPTDNLEALRCHLRSVDTSVVEFIETLSTMDMETPQWFDNRLKLSQLQAACLVARSVYCMFGNQYDCIAIYNKISDPKRPSGMNELDFYKHLMQLNNPDPDDIFTMSLEKLKLLFNYFEQLMLMGLPNLSQMISVHKISNEPQTIEPALDLPLAPVTFVSGHMQTSDPIKVDFANKNIGGGVLKHGCCQEELMFLSNPELIGLMSLVDTLGPYESLVVKGVTQYSKINYYGYDLRFAGTVPMEDRVNQTIIIMDANDYRGRKEEQYLESNKRTELQKAINGFSGIESSEFISTGNWGGGIFNGDFQLKFMIQLLAASLTGTKLIYYSDKTHELQLVYNWFMEYPVSKLYSEIMFKHTISGHNYIWWPKRN